MTGTTRDRVFTWRLAALLSITPVLVFGPVLHVHVPRGDHSAGDTVWSAQSHGGHSCHHAACQARPDSNAPAPARSDGPVDEHECGVCQVLGQARQIPQIVTDAEGQSFLVWTLDVCNESGHGIPPLAALARGPPA